MQKLKNESFASDGPPSDTMIRRNLDCYEVEGDLNQEALDDRNVAQTRGRWTGKWDFLMAALSYAVGLGNLWRFPYLVYRNGGGAFLIPYIIMNVVAGVPLFLLEMAIGQFSSSGAINVWNLCPLFRGMGVAMVTISGIIAPYYNMIIAWAMIFLFESFTSELPWSTCDNKWNGDGCVLRHEKILEEWRANCSAQHPDSSFKKGVCYYKDPITGNMTQEAHLNVTLVRPAHEYFHKAVLEITEGLMEIGGTRWQLVVSLLGCWVIVFFVIMKGPQSTGKAAYFTAIFPYLVLFILLIRGVTLEGWKKGIYFYLVPDWEKLTEVKVWGEAAVQVCFSLACGWGGVLTLASYKQFRSDIIRESYFICGVTAVTAILSGFVIFSVLGFMAEATGVEVDEVADQGLGLAFVVYPEAIAKMPVAPIWSILFFAMIVTLGIGTQIAIVTTVVSAIVDSSAKLVARRLWVTLVFCIVGFLVGIPFCTGGGVYILQLLDNYIAAWAIIILCILEMAIIGIFYGFPRLMDDIECMVGYRPSIVWRVLWSVISPITFIAILISTFVKLSKGDGSSYGSFKYPQWADTLGLVGSFVPIFLIPIIAVYKVLSRAGRIRDNFVALTKPSASWGPADDIDRKRRFIHSPTAASTFPMLEKENAPNGNDDDEPRDVFIIET